MNSIIEQHLVKSFHNLPLSQAYLPTISCFFFEGEPTIISDKE